MKLLNFNLKNQIQKNKLFVFWILFYTFFSIITIIISAVSPYFLFVNLQTKNNWNINFWIIIYSISFLSDALLKILNYLFNTKILSKQNILAAEDFFENMNKISYQHYNSKEIGTYYSWLQNNVQIRNKTFIISLMSLITSLFLSISFVILIFFFEWKIGLILLFFICLLIFYPIKISNILKTKLNAKLKTMENFNAKLENSVKGFNTLYFLNKQEHFYKAIKTNSKMMTDSYKKYEKNNFFANDVLKIVIDILSVILNLAIIIFTITSNQNTIVGVSLIVFFNLSLTNFWIEKKTFMNSLSSLLQIAKSKDELHDFIKEDCYSETNLVNLKEDIESIDVENLNFVVENKTIFENLNLNIQKNKKYLICGKNGAGKSTLIKILIGLERQYKGKVEINGLNIKTYTQKSLNEKFNYLTNNSILFNGTLEENISLFDSNFDKEKIENIIEKLDIQKLNIDNKKFGKNMVIDVSVGELQRINLARAFYNWKNMLIIDEGLSNIDKETFDKILNSLLINQNLTLLFITHHYDQNFSSKFDEIIEI